MFNYPHWSTPSRPRQAKWLGRASAALADTFGNLRNGRDAELGCMPVPLSTWPGLA